MNRVKKLPTSADRQRDDGWFQSMWNIYIIDGIGNSRRGGMYPKINRFSRSSFGQTLYFEVDGADLQNLTSLVVTCLYCPSSVSVILHGIVSQGPQLVQPIKSKKRVHTFTQSNHVSMLQISHIGASSPPEFMWSSFLQEARSHSKICQHGTTVRKWWTRITFKRKQLKKQAILKKEYKRVTTNKLKIGWHSYIKIDIFVDLRKRFHLLLY